MANIILQSGEVLNNRYQIIKLVGQGGFGNLYLARDKVLDRDCVLKGNLDPAPEAERQFIREAKILANLHHPNLPRVTDFFTSVNGGQYLVMDYIDGQDLQEKLDDHSGPLEEHQVLPWIEQICDALNYLHEQEPPVIHRDIKPGNIKITPDGRAVLIDFGIAKEFSPLSKTTVGAQAVTPGFSPVEQYGKGKTDARSDMYALGATLYTLLTYQEPPESVQRIHHDPLVSPRKINAELSKNMENVIIKALNIDPDQRYQNAQLFKQALARLRDKTLSSQKPSQIQISQNTSHRYTDIEISKILLVAIVGILLISLPFLLISLRHRIDQRIINPTIPATSFESSIVTYTPSDLVEPTEKTITDKQNPTPVNTPIVYKVLQGDICGQLAEGFGVSLQDLISINNLTSDCKISAGQYLLIQNPSEFQQDAITETVQITSTSVITRSSSQDSMTLVYIPAGPFLMGSHSSDINANHDEIPQHWVYLDAFWMDLTEVTNEMYAKCVQANSCEPPVELGSRKHYSYFDEPIFKDYPVINVSWSDANTYCLWAGRRLPTEAEWEKAARGYDGRIYPWGDHQPNGNILNFDNQIGDTVRVGIYALGKSPYGIYDMAGNVSEWVADWYSEDYYERSSSTNPLGAVKGDFRVIRGGSWLSKANAVRTTFRLWNSPDLQTEVLGFRCAVYADNP
jgi:eukaryotic-like serine/threonine-protein kinase